MRRNVRRGKKRENNFIALITNKNLIQRYEAVSRDECSEVQEQECRVLTEPSCEDITSEQCRDETVTKLENQCFTTQEQQVSVVFV